MALLSNNLYRDEKYKLDCETKIDYFKQKNPNSTNSASGDGLESEAVITNNLVKTDDNNAISSVYVKENNVYYSTTKISGHYHKLIR